MAAEQGARWDYIQALDDELLVGGVVLSEWTVRIVKEIDLCFSHGLYLACIVLSVSAIESHVKYETGERGTLHELIGNYTNSDGLISMVNKLRKYRNSWVHIDKPCDDEFILSGEHALEAEIEEMGFLAVRTIREILYTYQCI